MAKLLKIVSVLLIIGGVLSLIVGLLAFAGGAVIGSVDMAALDSSISASEGAMAKVGLTAATVAMGLLMLLSGVFTLLTGIFGLKGVNGNMGLLKTGMVLAWISLVLAVIPFFSLFSGGPVDGQSLLSAVLGLLLPLLYVIAAQRVKKDIAT